MVVDNNKGKVYESLSYPVFSPDSLKVAYLAREGKKSFIVINGKEIEFTKDILTVPVFAADSKEVGYGTRIGNELWWMLKSVE